MVHLKCIYFHPHNLVGDDDNGGGGNDDDDNNNQKNHLSEVIY